MRDDEIDPLTGLFNRRGLDRKLDEVARVARDGSPGRTDRWRSIVMLDIDDFKQVNNEHTHMIGDAVLVDLARRLAVCAGDQSLVARVGGDEFTILSPHEPEECAGFFALLADDLHGGVVDGQVRVTMSAGAAVLRPDDIETSRRQADLAMWQAKAEGKARLCLHGPETEGFVQRRANLADKVRDQHEEILRLLELSRTDPLTGLGNRRALDRHVEILDRRSDPRATAVLFVDLDRFGELNHLQGDHEGDAALRLVGRTLRDLCRGSDVVVLASAVPSARAFRKGGEEFVIFAPVRADEDAGSLGERVRAGVERLGIVHGGDEEPVLTATIGISIARAGVSVEQALREAGVVMTRLKNAGRRNCVELVDPADRPAAHEVPHESRDDDADARDEDGLAG